jgi:hypothetical protein
MRPESRSIMVEKTLITVTLADGTIHRVKAATIAIPSAWKSWAMRNLPYGTDFFGATFKREVFTPCFVPSRKVDSPEVWEDIFSYNERTGAELDSDDWFELVVATVIRNRGIIIL